MMIWPLPFAVNDAGDDDRGVDATAAPPPIAPDGRSPTDANESHTTADGTAVPAEVAVTVPEIGLDAAVSVPAAAMGLGAKPYLSTAPAAAECWKVPKPPPAIAASAAAATNNL